MQALVAAFIPEQGLFLEARPDNYDAAAHNYYYFLSNSDSDPKVFSIKSLWLCHLKDCDYLL